MKLSSPLPSSLPPPPPFPSLMRDWPALALDLGMRIGELSPHSDRTSPPFEKEERMRASMRDEGYVSLPGLCEDHVDSCSRAIDRLEEAGLPPQFILLFDETWIVVDAASTALSSALGLANVQDFFIFNVKPGMTGWGMHRDRAGADSVRAFREDGLPMYNTVWVALTDASIETSCIYLLPSFADPSYRSIDSEPSEDPEIVLQRHQYVRALPVEQGTVLSWSQRVIHWGSASPPNAPTPRKTLAFAMADPSYELPSIHPPAAGSLPSVEARLALIAFTLVCYHHTRPVDDEQRSLLAALLQEHAHHLTDAALGSRNGNHFQRNLHAIYSQAVSSDDSLTAASVSALYLQLENRGLIGKHE
ncbi:MAG: hypothetical protein SGPRY_003377 [Prymnesium sp.]